MNSFLASYYHIKQFNLLKSEIEKVSGKSVRSINFPETLSERVVKNLIETFEEIVVYHCGKNCVLGSVGRFGDLISEKYEKIEVKAKTSNGPTSFGPTEKWDVLYILDINLELDNCKCWKILLSNLDFKDIKISKRETFKDQVKSGRRPRINLDKLLEQIPEARKVKIFEGKILNYLY